MIEIESPETDRIEVGSSTKKISSAILQLKRMSTKKKKEDSEKLKDSEWPV